MTDDELKALVRTVPDFPAKGVQFRDITTLVADARGLRAAIDLLAKHAAQAGAEAIAGMEARGFVFGAAVAAALGVGFLPVRKQGKLPVATLGMNYALEYGSDRLEIDPSLVRSNQRVVLVDDLIATGGTAVTAASLLRKAGATVANAVFVIDLPDLKGADRLRNHDVDVETLMAFEGE